jgi:hypothetical protein
LCVPQRGRTDEYDDLFFGSQREKSVEHADHSDSDPSVSSNSRITPPEPDRSASPSRSAARSENTNSTCRSVMSSEKERVRNTCRLPAEPAGWTVTLPPSRIWKIQCVWVQAFSSFNSLGMIALGPPPQTVR